MIYGTCHKKLYRMGNPQFICGIVEGYLQIRLRVSAELFKGICEFVEGHQLTELSKASMESSHYIPRIYSFLVLVERVESA